MGSALGRPPGEPCGSPLGQFSVAAHGGKLLQALESTGAVSEAKTKHLNRKLGWLPGWGRLGEPFGSEERGCEVWSIPAASPPSSALLLTGGPQTGTLTVCPVRADSMCGERGSGYDY